MPETETDHEKATKSVLSTLAVFKTCDIHKENPHLYLPMIKSRIHLPRNHLQLRLMRREPNLEDCRNQHSLRKSRQSTKLVFGMSRLER
jgi:hypothetical protein